MRRRVHRKHRVKSLFHTEKLENQDLYESEKRNGHDTGLHHHRMTLVENGGVTKHRQDSQMALYVFQTSLFTDGFYQHENKQALCLVITQDQSRQQGPT